MTHLPHHPQNIHVLTKTAADRVIEACPPLRDVKANFILFGSFAFSQMPDKDSDVDLLIVVPLNEADRLFPRIRKLPYNENHIDIQDIHGRSIHAILVDSVYYETAAFASSLGCCLPWGYSMALENLNRFKITGEVRARAKILNDTRLRFLFNNLAGCPQATPAAKTLVFQQYLRHLIQSAFIEQEISLVCRPMIEAIARHLSLDSYFNFETGVLPLNEKNLRAFEKEASQRTFKYLSSLLCSEPHPSKATDVFLCNTLQKLVLRQRYQLSLPVK